MLIGCGCDSRAQWQGVAQHSTTQLTPITSTNTHTFTTPNTTGTGRRVGENCEQLWALLRPVMKVLRYAAKQGYLDGLDLCLVLISADKLQDAAELNVAAERACHKKLSKFLDLRTLLTGS